MTSQTTNSIENVSFCANDQESISDLWQALFQSSPVGILLFDDFAQLIAANRMIFKYFNQPETSVAGALFGNFFQCKAAVDGNGICGEMPDCQRCLIRGLISGVLASGKEISNAELEHEFTLNGRDNKKWFSINATPIRHQDAYYVAVSLVDITKVKHRERELVQLGITDELTGLYNRRFIMNQLNLVLTHAHQHKVPFSIALLDIDNFKNFNDRYGHLSGDEVLREFAETIRSNIRYSDFAGRFGGEEFLIILPGCKKDAGQKIINRIASQMLNVKSFTSEEEVTFSGGFVEVPEGFDELLDSHSLFAKADRLLYVAKANGKNQIEAMTL